MTFDAKRFDRLCAERRRLVTRIATIDSELDLVGAKASGRTLADLMAATGLALSTVQQRLLPPERRRSRARAGVEEGASGT